MARFFTDTPLLTNDHRITGEDGRHLSRSLRMVMGDKVTLCDGKGTDYQCIIKSIDPEGVDLTIISRGASLGEPKLDITLYQALPKGDKLDFIIQKATELGVVKVVPMLTNFCVSRPKGDAMKRKLLRYQKVAQEAAKQSGRGIIPVIADLMDFSRAIDEISRNDFGILCYEKADNPISTLPIATKKSIAIIIGSEGGFSADEVDYAVKKGIESVSLGRRILRCETAPIVAVTIALNMAGEF